MPKSLLPPHLISFGTVKRCSECETIFDKDAKPSVSRAFADHVRKKHRAAIVESEKKLTAPADYHKVK